MLEKAMARAPGRDVEKAMTARDVARLLGVSQSMISRAFDSRASVAPANRERIIRAAEALGYRPNVIARSLSTRRSGIVAIVMGNMGNPFYPSVLEQLALALDEAGFRSLLFNAPAGEDVDGQLPHLEQYNVDALIVASASISSRIAREWSRGGRRVVMFNRTVAGGDAPGISCDNEGGGRAVADLLFARGHERIVYVAGPRDTSTNLEREAGFLGRLMELAVPLTARIDTGEYSFAAGAAAAGEAARHRPDAIFFANDILAIGGMEALRHAFGLRVPEDVSVVGFDDIPMAAWPSFGLTTIRQPVEAMVGAAVDVITAGPAVEAGDVRIPGVLVERSSVRAAAD